MVEPGYKTFRLAPVIGEQLTFAEVSHKCRTERLPAAGRRTLCQAWIYAEIPRSGTDPRIVTCPDGIEREYTGGDYVLSDTQTAEISIMTA